MRLEEFLEQHSLAVFPVDRFAGYVVEVGVPPGWDLFNSVLGMRVWVCSDDPRRDEFCANAVLTMHRVEGVLEAGDVFTMLTEQQLHSVPGCRELHRELAAATDGPGVAGALFTRIADELGTIDSVSRSRIISAEQETLIAQLTVTALQDSPVDRAHIWLSVQMGAATGPTSADHHAPVTKAQDGR